MNEFILLCFLYLHFQVSFLMVWYANKRIRDERNDPNIPFAMLVFGVPWIVFDILFFAGTVFLRLSELLS